MALLVYKKANIKIKIIMEEVHLRCGVSIKFVIHLHNFYKINHSKASQYGYLSVFDELCMNGANINAQTSAGKTSLMIGK